MNSAARSQRRGAAAPAYCERYGLTAFPVPPAHRDAFAAEVGCTPATARRHLWYAIAYQVIGIEVVPPGWAGVRPGSPRGGKRDGAGRPHKAPQN